MDRYCRGLSGFRLLKRIKSRLKGIGLILAPYNNLDSFISRYTFLWLMIQPIPRSSAVMFL